MATADQIRAFLDRPWARLRREKDRYVSDLIEREGTDTAFRLAAGLRAYAREMGAVPSAADRRADLEAAVRLRSLLDRAGRRPRRAR